MTMGRAETVARLIEGGIVAILRADRNAGLVEVSRALSDGGVRAIEVTMTTPGALETIAALARDLPRECLLGAGSILDPETARACILAGATFLVAPIVDVPTIELAHRYDVAMLPGALTPTEIVKAWQSGGDLIKVFPADTLGPAYIRALKGPLPQIKLCPTGGVTAENVAQWLRAGASCVGAGGALVSARDLQSRNFAAMTTRAQQFVDAVRDARR